MNLIKACCILKQIEEGKIIPQDMVDKAEKIVAVAQSEFIILKAQINYAKKRSL